MLIYGPGVLNLRCLGAIARYMLWTGVVCGTVTSAAAQGPPPRSADIEFFETRVRPVLATNCYGCHGPEKQFNSLRLDSRAAMMRGGKRGPVLVSGKPEDSLLIQAVRHQGLQMPLGGRLEDSQIAALEEWIRRGALWPLSPAVAIGNDRYERLAREHWAFQPVKKPPLPRVAEAKWSRSPVDPFVYRALKKAGLSPAEPAGRRILIRRLSYVLTGLPPTAAESDRFVADSSPGAYQGLVDHLLASPRFGEHWARHWLDLVRYGETRGYEWNFEIIGAWRYRDYLIRAFNADVPYDQLVREHIAGDLLEEPRINQDERINESVIGTAFYRLGEAGHDDCIKFRGIALDVMDNQIDTLTKTFQALTVACARCHDHKLDPIPTEDYYGVYGILNSSRVVAHTIDTAEVNAKETARLRRLKPRIRNELAKIWLSEAKDVAQYLLSAAPSSNPAQASISEGLDPNRVEAWRNAVSCPEQGLADPGHPWAVLLDEGGGSKAVFQAGARELAALYRGELTERVEFNSANFEPFADFRYEHGSNWHASGMGLRQGPAPSGDFVVAPGGDRAVTGVFPAGIYTHTLSGRLNGSLRSPTLPKDKKYLSVRAMGGILGAHRKVIDNCAIGEKYEILNSDSLRWNKVETEAEQEQLPVFVELVTKWENPRIPDRPKRSKAQPGEIESPTSYFGVVEAVLHDVDEVPREELSHMMRLFDADAPSDWNGLAARYAAGVGMAVTNWAAGRATDDDARWLDWLTRNDLLSNKTSASPRLRALIHQYRAVEARISPPRVVEGLADGGPGRDFPVLIGGDPKGFGKPASRLFLRYLFGAKPIAVAGSGRRELAEVIASPDNPLTARVMVNRIWHDLFGRGIVGSVDNFGLIGDRPTHPELLDYLAARFVEEGWSIKKMIRLLALSETFQQAGEASPDAVEVDPRNELLHHYPLRRLAAEALRDSILLTSGNLQDSMFGPSIHPNRAEAKEYRRLFSGPLDGEGRRSIYIKVTRMEGAKFLETFDYPSPMATRGRRDVTNVPAQALTLLNDPFMIAEATACANRLLDRQVASVEDRITDLFRMTLGRDPTGVEQERFGGLATELAGLRQVPRSDLLNSEVVWKDLAHAVLNLKEFMYIQ